jgi:hypothetical protein
MTATTSTDTLAPRVRNLDERLAEYRAHDYVIPEAGIFPAYNVVIDEAKEALPDDQSVAELTHAPEHAIQAGVLRMALGLILAALPKPEPRSGGGTITGDLMEKDF